MKIYSLKYVLKYLIDKKGVRWIIIIINLSFILILISPCGARVDRLVSKTGPSSGRRVWPHQLSFPAVGSGVPTVLIVRVPIILNKKFLSVTEIINPQYRFLFQFFCEKPTIFLKINLQSGLPDLWKFLKETSSFHKINKPSLSEKPEF